MKWPEWNTSKLFKQKLIVIKLYNYVYLRVPVRKTITTTLLIHVTLLEQLYTYMSQHTDVNGTPLILFIDKITYDEPFVYRYTKNF